MVWNLKWNKANMGHYFPMSGKWSLTKIKFWTKWYLSLYYNFIVCLKLHNRTNNAMFFVCCFLLFLVKSIFLLIIIKWGHNRQFEVIREAFRLLVKLNNNKNGCYIGNVCANAFGYADDIVILSPTCKALRALIAICEKYANEHKILFNPDKCTLLIFSDIDFFLEKCRNYDIRMHC